MNFRSVTASMFHYFFTNVHTGVIVMKNQVYNKMQLFLRTLEMPPIFDIWAKNPSIILKSLPKFIKVDLKNTKNNQFIKQNILLRHNNGSYHCPLTYPLKYMRKHTCLSVCLSFTQCGVAYGKIEFMNILLYKFYDHRL